MWSEHCSYKHSRRTLKLFPTEGPRVVVGPGENAGVVDIGDGLVVAFKMESHNHPSAVEPYQGAATGVGGILRDIFTMGARPVALLDNLRFGEPDAPRMAHLAEGVVEGIAGYGNCIGVPTVAGDVMFDAGYAGNILVNVMCVGVARRGDILLAHAGTPGHKVLYFGSPTGRDGIHGATFASEELSEEALGRRGAVQVGDPFMGKKILEASLELIRRRLVAGMQDMGAAGLTCSTSEMAGRGGAGMEVDLDRVPQRAKAMTAYEIMLSESQERMLAVVAPENVEAALEVCRRWECGGAIIGEVTGTGRLVVRHHGEVVADLDAAHLTASAPVYDPAAKEPPPAAPEPPAADVDFPPEDLCRAALDILASPTVASKRWVWERYDHQVGAGTAVQPGDAAAAVVRVRGEGGAPDKFLAVSSGGNHRHVARAPRTGGQIAVCEVARALACIGAEPLGMTNCLNFGSPERPENFWVFREAVAGMAEACRALGIPVTGGNVSLYNESDGVAIPPTPMVGMVGLLAGAERIVRPGFRTAGDMLLVLGPEPSGIGGSEFDKVVLHASGFRGTPAFSLEAEVALQRVVRELAAAGLLRSAHPIGVGGLFVALAECALLSPGGLGAKVEDLPGPGGAVSLFGELPGRVLVSAAPEDAEEIHARALAAGVPCFAIGEVEEGDLDIEGLGGFGLELLRDTHDTNPFED
jgi:phosphoribosylformylglycinamidine synthase